MTIISLSHEPSNERIGTRTAQLATQYPDLRLLTWTSGKPHTVLIARREWHWVCPPRFGRCESGWEARRQVWPGRNPAELRVPDPRLALCNIDSALNVLRSLEEEEACAGRHGVRTCACEHRDMYRACKRDDDKLQINVMCEPGICMLDRISASAALEPESVGSAAVRSSYRFRVNVLCSMMS